MYIVTGLLSNQGEKSINFYFIRVPLRKKYKSMVLQSPGYSLLGLSSKKKCKMVPNYDKEEGW